MATLNSPAVAVIVLGQASVLIARQIVDALPNALLYGLEHRTVNVDRSFTQFGETVRELFDQGTAIVGICAAGILIRTVAPLLTNKWQEPPVIAIAEDGSAVVPLLGGLHGANDLARQIATVLQTTAAITTTGDIRFRTALLSPPKGYRLRNPEDAKKFLADLLAGATVKIEGNAPWLKESQLSIAEDATLSIRVTEQSVEPGSDCLIYHPATIVVELNRSISHDAEAAIATVENTLSKLNLSLMSIAAVLTSDPTHSGIRAIAQTLQVPIRWGSEHLENVIHQDQQSKISIASIPIDPNTIGQTPGKLSIIGTGPGSSEWMSPQVKEVLRSSTDWIGYQTYLNLVEPLRTNQQCHIFDNREELDRAALALDLAAEGRSVVMVSSGDPGIYAMAAAVFEVLERDAQPDWTTIDIQVCPGISAMQAAAAQVGAPLGHDFCAISLSDILKPWETIAARISAAAQGDFAIAFYNPVSKTRTWQLEEAKALLLNYRSPETPIVLAQNLGRPGQKTTIKTLGSLSIDDADMRTVILIGSSKTRTFDRAGGGTWVYTPRHYES